MLRFLSILTISFILSGCGSTSTTDTKYEQANNCRIENPTDDEVCQPLWDRWHKAEKRREIKAAWAALYRCPDRHVFVCNDSWCTQRTQRRGKPPKYSEMDLKTSGCAPRRAVMDALRRSGHIQ